MPALNAQSAILDTYREFSESQPNRKVVPSTPRLSFWTVLFRHNQGGLLAKGLLPSRRHFEKREDPGDEVGKNQSRSQSPRYPRPADQRTSGLWDKARRE